MGKGRGKKGEGGYTTREVVNMGGEGEMEEWGGEPGLRVNKGFARRPQELSGSERSGYGGVGRGARPAV